MAFPTAKIFADPFGSFLRGMRQGLEDNRRDFETWLRYQNLLLDYAKTLAALSDTGEKTTAEDEADPTSVLAELGSALDEDTQQKQTWKQDAQSAAEAGALKETSASGINYIGKRTLAQPASKPDTFRDTVAGAPTAPVGTVQHKTVQDRLPQTQEQPAPAAPQQLMSTQLQAPPAVPAKGQSRILPEPPVKDQSRTITPETVPPERFQQAYEQFGIPTMLQRETVKAPETPPPTPPIPNPLAEALDRFDKTISGEYKAPEPPPVAAVYPKPQYPKEQPQVTPQDVRDNLLLRLRAKAALVRESRLPPDVKMSYLQRIERILSSPAPTGQLVPVIKALEQEIDRVIKFAPPRRKKYYDRIPAPERRRKKYYDGITD